MSKEKALRWPYGIALSFIGIIALIIGTIIVAQDNKVEDADLYMQNYHVIDENVNEILYAQIAFKKKYDIEFATEALKLDGTVIAYRLQDKLGNPITDAQMEVILTRPNTRAYDMNLKNPTVGVDGLYEFESVNLPLEGRWNVMAKVTVGENYRYFNLKADTRYTNTFEY
jgi:nitrogen fixation protein FixH